MRTKGGAPWRMDRLQALDHPDPSLSVAKIKGGPTRAPRAAFTYAAQSLGLADTGTAKPPR